MNRNQGHLDIDALGDLLRAGSPSSRLPQTLPQEMQHHLRECEACRKLMEMYEASGRDLESMRLVGPLAPSPECPNELLLRQLAAGLLDEDRADKILEHLPHCSRCAPLYREFSEEMSSDLSVEEEQILAALRLSEPSAQTALAQSLATVQPRTSRNRIAVLSALAAALVLCAALLWMRYGQTHANPNSFVAAAYAEHRPFDFRLEDAPYAPLHVERGARSAGSKSESLLQAELRIKQALSHSPDDATLLDAKSKAELFESQYDAAIADSIGALHRRPDLPAFLSDLAIAFALRGDEQNQSSDYTKANDLLAHALQIAPSNRVALFNKALVDERLGRPAEAQKDWKQYLALDAGSDWANEAREHLTSIHP